MRVIRNSLDTTTFSLRIPPEYKDFFVFMLSSLKKKLKNNKIRTAEVNQGQLVMDMVHHLLSSNEIAYRIGENMEMVTYKDLLISDISESIPMILKKIETKFYSFTKAQIKNAHRVLLKLEEPLEQEVLWTPVYDDLIDESVESYYPSGVKFLQLIDETCRTEYVKEIETKIQCLLKDLLDKGYGKYNDGRICLIITKNLDIWE